MCSRAFFFAFVFQTLPVIALVDVLTCMMLAHLEDGCLFSLGFSGSLLLIGVVVALYDA